MYGAKNVMLFLRMASGVGFPYVVASWSNMLRMDIVEFHPVVGGVFGGATLKASLMCLSCVVAHLVYVLPRFKVILHYCVFSVDGGFLLSRVWHCYFIWIEFVRVYRC